MAMLAYSTLDIFSEKAQLIPDRVKTLQDQKDKQMGKEPSKEMDPTYLGLLTQTFVDRYEMDVYGYVSVTNFKYVVFKIETRLNPVNSGNSERALRIIFEKLQSLHTQMMLNPFYNFDSHGSFIAGSGGAGLSKVTVGRAGTTLADEDDLSDFSSSSCSSNNSSTNEQAANTPQSPQKQKQLNSKRINDDCLQNLKKRVDGFVTQCDINLRNK